MAKRRPQLLGAPLDAITLSGAVEAAERMISERRSGQHASVNAAKLVRLQTDERLREALWTCDVVTADGQPVVWAARLLGEPVPERVAGIDLMEALLERAAERGFRVYLLGARAEVLHDAEAEVRRRWPKVVICGRHHGYFSPEEEAEITACIARAEADLLFVALETPQKELFLARHSDVLRVPFAMGVGGAFDILAGRRARAPRWAQRVGVEWLFRLLQDPRRLAGRYLIGNTLFVGLVLREFVRRRLRRRVAGASS